MASVKELRQVNIVGVAESLGMELKPDNSRYYRWKDHDSLVIDVRKNWFNWYSRDKYGDPIALVRLIREEQTGQPVSFKEAKQYVETGSFPTVTPLDDTHKEFSNYLSRYESKDKTLMVDYLKNERGLSEETIRFFDEKGVLAQANYQNAQGIEPIIIFRTLDATGKMIGGSLQGIVENRDLYDRGRLKQIMKHSDGSSGFNVDIGSPKRLIVAEAPIDLMSYYELHKGELNDVRLVAMDGLKEGTISRHYMEILHLKRGKVYEVDHKKTPQALSNIAKTSTHFKQEENRSVITLAVDNDSAGRKFLSRLEDKGICFVSDLPPLPAGKDKSDWNDHLKQEKLRRATVEERSNVVPRMLDIDEIKHENEELVINLEERIKAGELSLRFDTDAYLYDVFGKLGHSYPMKYINDKRLEVLAPIQTILASIDDETVNLYKQKGTMEQDSLYQYLKPHQRTLRVDISTRFIGELAIAAYNTNKLVSSISSDYFGVHYGERTMDNLSQSIEKMLEYPLIDLGVKDFDYGYVTTPNALYHYLQNCKGEVVLNRNVLNTLLSTLEKQPLQVISQEEKKESNMEIVKENSTIDQSQEQEKEIASYIESITAEDHGFYLWYDEELENLGASDEVIEAFHEALPEKTYTINGIQLFVEESINDGATGYLSLDGDMLNSDGIKDYLANSELTYDQKISLLQSLEDRLPAIWDEVVQSYEKVYKEIVSRFQLDKKDEADYYVRLHHSMHPSLSQLGDGAAIPYKQLVETLYPENKRLLEERASQIAEALASAGSDLQQLTTFDLIDPDGAIVERNITYDAGDELETIAEKNKTAPYGADLLAIDREVSERLGISHDFKQQKKDETKLGDFPVKQEAAPLPEANESQPLNDLSPNQTRSQPLLHFTIRDDAKSIHKDYYHPATQKEIAKLNRYTPTIQQTAQWYLDKVADSRIIYLYQDGDSISGLAVQFDRDKFMHLTGIYPYQEGQTAEQTLLDFANGKGDFDTILLANKGATFDKVKVLPELEAIVESDSFYFGDLSEVPKLKRLDLDKAIRSGDEDVLLAMRTVDGTTFPASLMKLRQSLKLQLDSTNQERSILGVYRYRDNQLDQLSINEELIKDGGESFESILDQVVENLNQADQTDKTVDKDMVYQDQPLVQDQLEEQGKTEVGFQPSTYRLEQAKDKLIRLETELNQAVQDIFDHQKLTNGQPVNDKKGSQSWYRREAQLDGRASDLRQQIEDQKNYIEHLERQMEWLSRGYDRKGQGLRLTIDNIPNIEREIELAKAGQGNFSQATIRKYQKELERLKASQGILEKIHLSPEARALIDEGILNQWKKQPFIYFVKGLDKVALELTETGVFRISQKYAPQTVEAKKQISELLEQLNSKEQVVETSNPVQVEEVQHQLEPDKQEEAKPELVDSTFYTQTSNQNKLSELLASKDRAGLAQHLKEGVHQYLNSEQYKDFLNTMSRFPNYSYRNIQLLKAQMPTVQVVASFKSWKEDFGRTVIKGSKSLRIFAPQITKLRDPQTGEVLKDEQGNDKTRITFKLVPVFDISQTEGKELPKPIYQLEGNHENYSKLYRSAKAYAQSKGLTMEFNSNIGEANGYYSRKENKIVIKAGMSEQQTLKTIYHELAHADLHSSQTVTKDLQYSDAELQAESVAYVVANHYGLDTSEYSFGYLATWVRDKEALSDLEAQLEIVQKEAQHLLNSLDMELEKQLEQVQVQTVEKVEPVEKLSFEERLARAEQESKLLAEEQGKEEEQAKKQEAKQSIQER